MQTLCDLLEPEPMEPVFSTLTPHEVLVLCVCVVGAFKAILPCAAPEPLTSEPIEKRVLMYKSKKGAECVKTEQACSPVRDRENGEWVFRTSQVRGRSWKWRILKLLDTTTVHCTTFFKSIRSLPQFRFPGNLLSYFGKR